MSGSLLILGGISPPSSYLAVSQIKHLVNLYKFFMQSDPRALVKRMLSE